MFIITICVFIYLFIVVFRIRIDVHPYTDNNIEYLKRPDETNNVSEYIKLTNNITALQNVIGLYNEKIDLLRSKKTDVLVNISIAKNSQYILEKEKDQLEKQLDAVKNIISTDEGELSFLQYQSLLLQIYLWKKISKDYLSSGYPELMTYQNLLFRIYVWNKISNDYLSSGYPELIMYRTLLFRIYVWNKISKDVLKSIS